MQVSASNPNDAWVFFGRRSPDGTVNFEMESNEGMGIGQSDAPRLQSSLNHICLRVAKFKLYSLLLSERMNPALKTSSILGFGSREICLHFLTRKRLNIHWEFLTAELT